MRRIIFQEPGGALFSVTRESAFELEGVGRPFIQKTHVPRNIDYIVAEALLSAFLSGGVSPLSLKVLLGLLI